MPSKPQPDPSAVLKRLHEAMTSHDLDAVVACFSADYVSEQPTAPDRDFRGDAQVRKNWGAIFADIPDFQAELFRFAVYGDAIWSEWDWHGTPVSGGRFHWRGVIILGVPAGRIAWGRLYMGPVHQSGGGIDAVVRSMGQGDSDA